MNAPSFCLAVIVALSPGVAFGDTKFDKSKGLAERGDAKAQFELGCLYATGAGVPKDSAKAVEWYRKAADQGYASAQFNLGAMYSDGVGVRRDYVMSYMWVNLAAAQGFNLAKERIAYLEKAMTREQIAKAQELSGIYAERIEAAKAKN